MDIDTDGLEAAHRAYVRRMEQMAHIDISDGIRARMALIAAIRGYVQATDMPVARPHPAAGRPAPVTDARPMTDSAWVRLDSFVFDADE
jgi:hypothetical protein